MLTDRQARLISKCKSAGHGWRKFAESVENQGFCTHWQEEKLVEMHQKITHAECVKADNIKPNVGCWDTDISDSEAYQSHDYF